MKEKFGQEFSQEDLTVFEQILSKFQRFKQTGQVEVSRGVVEGVFDMTHFGHFNILRQASAKCDQVVLLINSDRSVKEAKGPTLLTE